MPGGDRPSQDYMRGLRKVATFAELAIMNYDRVGVEEIELKIDLSEVQE